MARISDLIEEFIKTMMEDMDGVAEIRRNELAERFNCVPSQVTYVLETRFGSNQGYYILSRRGGGGGIRIIRAAPGDLSQKILQCLHTTGRELSQQAAALLLKRLRESGQISARDEMILLAAVSDKALSAVDPADRKRIRAAMLRNALAAILTG